MTVRFQHLTWIVGIFLLSSLLLSRVYKGTVTLYDSGDDDQYWAYPHSLIYQGNLDLAHDSLPLFQRQPSKLNWMSPFPGFLWSPAVLLGKVLAPVFVHFPGVSAVDVAAGSSPPQRLLVSALSACLTLGGLLLLYHVLSHFFSGEAAFASVIVLFLSTPLPYYTFRRPLMAHSAELFSMAMFALCSLRFCKHGTRSLAFWAGFTAALATGVRYPNVFVVGSWLLMLAWLYKPKAFWERSNWGFFLAGGLLPAVVQVVIWKKLLGTWINHMGAYSLEPSNIMSLLAINGQTLHSLFQIFFGQGWGLFWTETPVILALWLTVRGGSLYAKELRVLFFAGVLPLLLVAANNPYVIGASYGYRYLLADGLWMAFGLSLFYDTYGKSRLMKALPFALCLFPLLAYFLFESGPESLTLHQEEGWGNAHFVMNVLSTLLHDPKQVAFALSGNPVVHILLWIASKTVGLGFLPGVIRLKVSVRLNEVPLPYLFWYLGCIWSFSLGLLGLLRLR